MNRDELERQVNRQYKDKTPEEMIEIGRQIGLGIIREEKQQVLDRISGLKAIFNLCSPPPSDKFKKIR